MLVWTGGLQHVVCIRKTIGKSIPGQDAKQLRAHVFWAHMGTKILPHVLTPTPLTQHMAAGHRRRALLLKVSYSAPCCEGLTSAHCQERGSREAAPSLQSSWRRASLELRGSKSIPGTSYNLSDILSTDSSIRRTLHEFQSIGFCPHSGSYFPVFTYLVIFAWNPQQ